MTHEILDRIVLEAQRIAANAQPDVINRVNLAYAGGSDDSVNQKYRGATRYQYNLNTVYAPPANYDTLNDPTKPRQASDYLRGVIAKAYNISREDVTLDHARMWSTLHEYGHAIDNSERHPEDYLAYKNSSQIQYSYEQAQGQPMHVAYRRQAMETVADYNAKYMIQHAVAAGMDIGGLKHGWNPTNITLNSPLHGEHSGNGEYTPRLMVPDYAAGETPGGIFPPAGLAPISHFDASMIGNPIRAFTRAVAGDLGTGTGGRGGTLDIYAALNARANVPGPRGGEHRTGIVMSSQTLNGLMGFNIANVIHSGKARGVDSQVTGQINGVTFNAKPQYITADDQGVQTSWLARAVSGKEAADWQPSEHDLMQSEITGVAAGAQRHGVMGFNMDTYSAYLKDNGDTPEAKVAALAASIIGQHSDEINRDANGRVIPSEKLASKVDELARIQAASRRGFGLPEDAEAFAFGIDPLLTKGEYAHREDFEQMRIEAAHHAFNILANGYQTDEDVNQDFGSQGMTSRDDLREGMNSSNVRYRNFLNDTNPAGIAYQSIQNKLRSPRRRASAPTPPSSLPEFPSDINQVPDYIGGGSGDGGGGYAGSGELPIPESGGRRKSSKSGVGELTDELNNLHGIAAKTAKVIHDLADGAGTLTGALGGGGRGTGGRSTGAAGGGTPADLMPPDGQWGAKDYSLDDKLRPFFMRGSGRGDAIERNTRLGMYGDSGASQGAWKAVGEAASFSNTLIGNRWAIRGMEQEFIQPLENARTAYLGSRQNELSNRMHLDMFGGMGLANTDEYNLATGAGIANQNRQRALGEQAERGYGVFTTQGTQMIGSRNISALNAAGNMAAAGGGIGYLAAGALGLSGPVGALAGGLIGGAAFIGGQTMSAASDSSMRQDIMYNYRQGGVGGMLRNDLGGTIGYAMANLGATIAGGDVSKQWDAQFAKDKATADMAANFMRNPTQFTGADISGRPDVMQLAVKEAFNKESNGEFVGIGPNLADETKQKLLAQTFAMVGKDRLTSPGGMLEAKMQYGRAAQATAAGVDLNGIASQIGTFNGVGGGNIESAGYSQAFESAYSLTAGKNGNQAQAMFGQVVGGQYGLYSAQLRAGQRNTANPVQFTLDMLSADQNGQRQLMTGQDLDTTWALGSGSSQIYNDAGKGNASGMYQYLRGGAYSNSPEQYNAAVGRLGSNTGSINALTSGYGMSSSSADSLMTSVERLSPIGRSGGAQSQGVSLAMSAGISGSKFAGQANLFGQMYDAGLDPSVIAQGSQLGFDMSAVAGTSTKFLNAQRGDLAANSVNNARGAVGMLQGAMRYGGVTPDVSNRVLGASQQLANDPQAWSMYSAALSGDPIALTMYGQQTGNESMHLMQTGARGGTAGMRPYYDEAISSDASKLFAAEGKSRGLVRGDSTYSPSSLASMNEVQLTTEMNNVQRTQRDTDFRIQRSQMNRSQAAYETNYGYETQGIGLQREQQDYQYQTQGQRLNLQGQQMQYEYGFQKQSMGIQRSHQVQEQQWGLENLAYQRNMSQMQFGFSMIDADESVRYSTGREKRVAMRHRDEAVTTFSMQQGQMDKEEERAKERIKWSDDQFSRDKSHFEQEHQFEQRNFQLTEQNYQKEREFIMKQRVLEDEKRAYNHQIHELDMADERASLESHQATAKKMDELSGALKAMRDVADKNAASQSFYASTLQNTQNILPGVIQQMLQLNSVMVTIANSPTAANNYNITPGGDGTRPTGGPYAAGGFTGRGPRGQVAGNVHREEFVIPAEGAPIMVSPEQIAILKLIHEELKGIHKDGGNAVVNVNTSSPRRAARDGVSLYERAYSAS